VGKSFWAKLGRERRAFSTGIANLASLAALATLAKSAEYRAIRDELKSRQPNNLAVQGQKTYSQNDEDGIIAAIFGKFEHGRTFLEIGVQDGRECNTHLLLIDNWRGAWVEADADMCRSIETALGQTSFPGRFQLIEDFVSPENIVQIYRNVCDFLGVEEVALFSLDIDSNDIYVLESLFAGGGRPAVLSLEYQGAFAPPLDVRVTYAPGRTWAEDDYYGASLQAFVNVCGRYGYKLLTCSIVGVNAFFVRDDISGRFDLRPVEELYQPFRAEISSLPGGHVATLKFARDVLRQDGETAPTPATDGRADG
jgi:hypothetical protein